MAATEISTQNVAGPYVREGTTQLTTLTLTESDPTNMNKIVIGGNKTLILFRNTDTENAEWVTVYGSDDAYGRTADINQNDIDASGWAGFIFAPHGWEGSLGGRDLLIDTESTDVDIVAIPL